jgi:hypothetical protein
VRETAARYAAERAAMPEIPNCYALGGFALLDVVGASGYVKGFRYLRTGWWFRPHRRGFTQAGLDLIGHNVGTDVAASVAGGIGGDLAGNGGNFWEYVPYYSTANFVGSCF